MARLILDTSVLVAVHRQALPWTDVAAEDDEPAIAAVTAAELLRGALVGDPARRADRAARVEDDLARIPIEPYDLDVARVHADLLVATGGRGDPRGAHDLQIAATARARRRTVVTLDRRGFADLPGVTVRVPT